MKQIIPLFVLFVGVLCYNVPPQAKRDTSIEPYVFEDLINSTIEGFRPDIPDPVVIDSYEISLPDEEDAVVVGNASISNFKLAGLQGFQVTALNFQIVGMQLNFTVVLPVLDLFTDFSLDLLISNSLANIWGDGNITVHLEGLAIEGSAQANLTGGIQIENLRLAIQLQDARFEIHGLMDDEAYCQVVSDMLNEVVVKLIDENQELITEVLSPLVQTVVNSILASLGQTTTVTPLDFPIGLK